jgi:hypothetical protein
MHDPGGVRSRERLRHLRGNGHRFSRRNRTFGNHGAQRISLNQFGHDVRRIVVQPHVVDGHDVRVIECRREPRLLFEAPPAFLVARQRIGQHLQRHIPAHARVQRFKDLAHSAGAKRADDFIRPYRAAKLSHAEILAPLKRPARRPFRGGPLRGT